MHYLEQFCNFVIVLDLTLVMYQLIEADAIVTFPPQTSSLLI